MKNLRYERAIQRNLAELQRAILNRTTMLGLEDIGEISHLFLKLIYFALFNDYIAHCIKVFEKSKQAASFWYIYRTNPVLIESYAGHYSIDIMELEKVGEKLKHIRDKTHFHIDSEGMLDTKSIWQEAGLSGKELSTAVDAVWSILGDLQNSLNLPELILPEYDRSDVKCIANVIEENQ